MGRVLRLADLLWSITRFQDGCTPDTLAVLRRLGAAYATKDGCYYNDPDDLADVFASWRARRGNLGLDVLCDKGYDRHLFCYALRIGDVGLATYVATKRTIALDELHWLLAVKYGHVGVLDFLYSQRDALPLLPSSLLSEAARWGHLPLVRYLHEKGLDATHILYCAVMHGHVHVAQYAHAQRLGQWFPSLVTSVVSKGDAVMLAFVLAHGYAGVTPRSVVIAAKFGHLALVQMLYAQADDAAFEEALFKASWHGHLHVVKWLDTQRLEADVPHRILDEAKMPLDVMKYFLLERRSDQARATALRCHPIHTPRLTAHEPRATIRHVFD